LSRNPKKAAKKTRGMLPPNRQEMTGGINSCAKY